MQEIDKIEKKPGSERENTPLEEDQVERSYYYDDAHGYQEYDPNIEDKEDTNTGALDNSVR